MKKEIDIDDELEKRYEKFHEWLDTCPVDWYEVGHPSSDIVCVNFLPDIFNKHIYVSNSSAITSTTSYFNICRISGKQ